MSIDLTKYGIGEVSEIIHNPSYEQLYKEELKPELEGFEKGVVSELGAVNVMTGEFTGRSPKDKYIVLDETTKNSIWWTSEQAKNDNKPISTAVWNDLKAVVAEQLSGKRLFVMDTFCGANEDTRLKSPFYYGSSLAGAFRKKYVYPSHRRRVKKLRRT